MLRYLLAYLALPTIGAVFLAASIHISVLRDITDDTTILFAWLLALGQISFAAMSGMAQRQLNNRWDLILEQHREAMKELIREVEVTDTP